MCVFKTQNRVNDDTNQPTLNVKHTLSLTYRIIKSFIVML